MDNRLYKGQQRICCTLICDARLANRAAALADKFASDWGVDVHVFLERTNPREEPIHMIEREGVYYHFEELLPTIRDLLPDIPRYSLATWARLLAPSKLTAYDLVIYCDIDILPGPFPEHVTELNIGNSLGMTGNYWTRYNARIGHKRTQDHMSFLGLSADAYFNAGVMVLEPKHWDPDAVIAGLKSFLRHKGDGMKSADQDFLCYYFKDRISELSLNFNFLQPMMGMGLEGGLIPSLRHYVMHPKPYENIGNWAVPSTILHARHEFQDLMTDAALQVDVLEPSKPPAVSKRMRHALRSLPANFGLRTARCKKEEAHWLEKRKIYMTLMEEAYPRCVDRFQFPKPKDYPTIRWNGFEVLIT